MRVGDKKIFNDREKLYQMVNLRRVGWAGTSLALLFTCDIEPIYTKCKQFGIRPMGLTYSIERIASAVIPREESKTRWKMSGGERLCMGRSYKDYLG